VKVIFVDDVPNVARVGQTKVVADGYARNFLFPKKLAVLANSQAAASIDAHLKKLIKQRAVEEAQVAELAKKINGIQITMRAKVGENDKLYGSITAADIADALSKAAGCLIDKKNVALVEPIKQAGLCDVTIKFMHEITAVIKANVIDENATDETPVKPKAVKADKAPEAAAEPKKEKKAKAPKAEKTAKEEPAAPVAEEKPAKAEKKAKAPSEKEVKQEKTELAAEAPAKPAKEKKAKAVKEEAPAAEVEEKKEKKPRAKAKKADAAAE
jgi:large subunit ribosomal protein L9